MSTEQKPPETQAAPHHKEHLERNALGQTILTGWEKFKAGQLISYKWMGIILIAVTAILVALYIYIEKEQAGSRRWVELESQNSRAALEKFAEQNPDTLVGHVAQFDLARYLLGPDGIDKLPTARDEAERKTAADNIEKSREMMTKLLDAFKDQPVLKVQCLVGLAKSEAALVGMYKDGSLSEMRGSVDKLIDWLDKIGEAAGETPWGEEAKKLSNSLKSGTTKDEFVNVQRQLYVSMPLPLGGGPIAPGKTPLDGIPGLPGGPSFTPPTPPAPKTPEPSPKAPDPKPPEPAPKAPDAKTPEPTPKAPDPKAPEPPKKTPEPVPPPKIPDPKPPEPPKK